MIIHTINQVRQRNGAVRFDVQLKDAVEVPEVVRRGICSHLRYMRRMLCSVRLHRPWIQRRDFRAGRARRIQVVRGNVGRVPPLRVQVGVGQGGQPVRRLKISSVNVNSVAGKRPELEVLLRENRIGILGIQETWRTPEGWPIRFPGYQVFEEVAVRRGVEAGRGHNGLALCISSKYAAFEVGTPSPFALGVQVSVAEEVWIVLNIYIPTRNPARNEALVAVRHAISRAVGNGNARVLVMGDWNMTGEQLDAVLAGWRSPVYRVPCSGNPSTYHAQRIWSDLDHFVVSEGARTQVPRSVVNREWDASDHFPINAKLLYREGVQFVADRNNPHGLMPRIDAGVVSRSVNFAHHNMWQELLVEEFDELDDNALPEVATQVVNEFAQAFVTQTHRVAAELHAVKPLNDGPLKEKASYRLTNEAKVAILRRRQAYREWADREAPEREDLWDAYVDQLVVAKRLKNESIKESWNKYIETNSKFLIGKQSKLFWKWASKLVSKQEGVVSGPVLNPQGAVVYQPDQIREEWKRHYEVLLSDVTGHSKDREYWVNALPGVPQEELEGINQEITWGELNGILHTLKAGAPGIDGIPSAVYKAAWENPLENFDPNEPRSSLGRVLLRLVRLLFVAGVTPEVWNVSVVVSIPKKGDARDMNNSRGISLIPVAMKLVTKILFRRIYASLEELGWFAPEQAGFREREECMGHACALYEVLHNRKQSNVDSYVAFLDVKKAYDTVPHEAFMRKLELIGVSGRILRFIRGLYTNARVVVRTSFGYSDPVVIQRGLRQGCTGSTIGFDIFVNDLPNLLRVVGVRILDEQRMGGCLFADDIAIVCESPLEMTDSLRIASDWATLHELQFGISKCGIMGIGDMAHNNVVNAEWILQDQRVPVVENYVYLGNWFNNDLDLDAMVQYRVGKGERALGGMGMFLRCRAIALACRVMVVKAMLIPLLTYGAELWGMSEIRTTPLQRILNTAIRNLLQLRSRSSVVSSATIGMELGIPNLHAIVSALRARAFFKYPSLKTIIVKLYMATRPTRCRGWIRGSLCWLRRYGGFDVDELLRLRFPLPEYAEDEIKVISKRVRSDRWQHYIDTKGGVSGAAYSEAGFRLTKHFIFKAVLYPQLCSGITWLVKARLGAIWTGSRLLQIRYLPEIYRDLCPCCERRTCETLVHLVLVCNRWHRERDRWLNPIIAEMPELTDVEKVRVLLGGRVIIGDQIEGNDPIVQHYSVPNWCIMRNMPGAVDVELDEAFNRDAPDLGAAIAVAPRVGDRELAQQAASKFVDVARYFHEVMPLRRAVIAPLIENAYPRANANNGMAELIPRGVGEFIHHWDG